MLKTNYHTHSTFCDGKNTIEEIVQKAIQLKFHILGFSGHSMFPFSSDWHIPSRNIKDYCEEVLRVKEKYSDQLKICLGFEADYIQGMTVPSFENYGEFKPDFLIGSVHYVPGKNGTFEADGNFEKTRKCVEEAYGGSAKKAVQAYFDAERSMIAKGDFTFIGHPDLIRKQNSPKNPTGPLFDEKDSWYRKEVDITAKAIAKSGLCVEINTGGMARQYLDSPYPSPYFLEKLHELKVPVTINSDSHSVETLDYWFEEAVQYAKKAGYTELMFHDSGSLKSQTI